MIQARLYIASCQADGLERLFAFDPGFFVLGSSAWGGEALRDILRLCPDVAILDGTLPGLDGWAIWDRLSRMATPPRVLFLDRLGTCVPADAVLRDPWTSEELLFAARAAASRPLPALAEPWTEEREQIADGLLAQLGVDGRLKGRGYLRFAAAALACAPQLAVSFSDRRYPLTAEAFRTTPGAVERAVRTAVEATWLQGDLKSIQALFGFSVDADRGKPTNAECLSMLAEHVRRRMEKVLNEASRAK